MNEGLEVMLWLLLVLTSPIWGGVMLTMIAVGFISVLQWIARRL